MRSARSEKSGNTGKSRSALRLAAGLLTVCLLLGSMGLFSSCAKKEQTLMELDGFTMSENVFVFLLSRVRGLLEQTGYPVNNADFWDTVVTADGVTYDEYFRQKALMDAKRYLAAMVLFREEGLSLPDSSKKAVDQKIEDAIRDAGSKSALNTTLSAYGINVDILKEWYLSEETYRLLQNHLYGANGEKISAQVRQEFLNEYAVCFRQVLIRSSEYVYEKDPNGDDIYYLPKENNAKVNNIAYDTVKGSPRPDKNGVTITDKNGDTVYYLADGKIAYDREKGIRAMTYDEKTGLPITKKYPPDVLARHRKDAEEIIASVGKGDYATFESLLGEYEISGDDAYVTDGEFCFLYTSGNSGDDSLNDIADVLTRSETGEIGIVDTAYGLNVVMKYPMPDDAVTNEAYKEWFADLPDRLVDWLFHRKCESLIETVTVDQAVFASLPSMKEVGTNRHY